MASGLRWQVSKQAGRETRPEGPGLGTVVDRPRCGRAVAGLWPGSLTVRGWRPGQGRPSKRLVFVLFKNTVL